MTKQTRILIGEFIGTALLMLGGPGAAVFASQSASDSFPIGTLGVALSFGLTLLVLAYVLGPITGCHINPAVTVAMVLAKRVDSSLAYLYIAAQLVGSIAGGGLVWLIAHGRDGFIATNHFAANGYGEASPTQLTASPSGFSLTAVAICEIVCTMVLCLAVLATTHKKFNAALGGVTVGLTLTLVHLISIPVSNTSVNPARSLGAAVFSGSDALVQLWAFFVFPLIGAALAAALFKFVWEPAENEEQPSEAIATS